MCRRTKSREALGTDPAAQTAKVCADAVNAKAESSARRDPAQNEWPNRPVTGAPGDEEKRVKTQRCNHRARAKMVAGDDNPRPPERPGALSQNGYGKRCSYEPYGGKSTPLIPKRTTRASIKISPSKTIMFPCIRGQRRSYFLFLFFIFLFFMREAMRRSDSRVN